MYNSGKAKIQNDFNGLFIQTPFPKNFLVIILFTAWLCAWFFFALDVFHTLQNPEEHRNYFLMLWLAIWTLGGIRVIRTILWALFGKETLNVTNQEIKFKDTIFGFGKTYLFPAHELTTIEFNQPSVTEESDYSGKILLHRGVQIYSYGTNLDINEAMYIIDLIKNKVPHLKNNHQHS